MNCFQLLCISLVSMDESPHSALVQQQAQDSFVFLFLWGLHLCNQCFVGLTSDCVFEANCW